MVRKAMPPNMIQDKSIAILNDDDMMMMMMNKYMIDEIHIYIHFLGLWKIHVHITCVHDSKLTF